MLYKLGERLFDRIEVRAIGRQIAQRRASSLDRFPDEGRCHPMAMRRGGFEAAPARGAAIEPHHIGLCSGFINEDKMLRVQIGLARTPLLARLGDIGAVLFGGVQCFF